MVSIQLNFLLFSTIWTLVVSRVAYRLKRRDSESEFNPCTIQATCFEEILKFAASDSAQDCQNVCEKFDQASWFSWNEELSFCACFASCDEKYESSQYISGPLKCSMESCSINGGCSGGQFLGVIKVDSIEICHQMCSLSENCEWITYQKPTGWCIMYRDCPGLDTSCLECRTAPRICVPPDGQLQVQPRAFEDELTVQKLATPYDELLHENTEEYYFRDNEKVQEIMKFYNSREKSLDYQDVDHFSTREPKSGETDVSEELTTTAKILDNSEEEFSGNFGENSDQPGGNPFTDSYEENSNTKSEPKSTDVYEEIDGSVPVSTIEYFSLYEDEATSTQVDFETESEETRNSKDFENSETSKNNILDESTAQVTDNYEKKTTFSIESHSIKETSVESDQVIFEKEKDDFNPIDNDNSESFDNYHYGSEENTDIADSKDPPRVEDSTDLIFGRSDDPGSGTHDETPEINHFNEETALLPDNSSIDYSEYGLIPGDELPSYTSDSGEVLSTVDDVTGESSTEYNSKDEPEKTFEIDDHTFGSQDPQNSRNNEAKISQTETLDIYEKERVNSQRKSYPGKRGKRIRRFALESDDLISDQSNKTNSTNKSGVRESQEHFLDDLLEIFFVTK